MVVAAWGDNATVMDDLFDETAVARSVDGRPGAEPLTTWHDGESIEDTLEFFLGLPGVDLRHDPAPVVAPAEWVPIVLVVNKPALADTVRGQLSSQAPGEDHRSARTPEASMSDDGTSRRRISRVLLVLLLLVGTVVAMLWALQRQLIYFPDSTQVPPAAELIVGARDVSLHTADGLDLGAYFVPAAAREDTGMAVLLAPGNGGNRAGRVGLAEELSRRGLAVLLLDYRGYGGNPGSPSEDGLAADADAAVLALDDLGYPPQRILYFGESLGTGVVAALQARQPPAGVVLRSPFTELADVGAHHYPWLPVRALLRDRFPVTEHLATSDVPVTVIYGDRDSVVSSALSAQVADRAPSLVERVVFTGADHNDPVMFGPRVADAVQRLAQSVD